MNFKHLALAAATVCLLATPAVADGHLQQSSDSDAAVSWTGFYVGGWVGGRASRITNKSCFGTCASGFGLDGFIGGLNVGYDYQLNSNWVLGAYASLPLARPTTTATSPAFPGASWAVKPDWAFSTGARFGYAIDQFLPYVFAGVEVARVTVTPNVGIASSATQAGAILGAGLEYKITDNWTIDGRYALGLVRSGQFDFCPATPPLCQSTYSEVAHNFIIGVNYRF